ncbi:MAG: YjfB family protein [Gammaproteobacteria bacterium]|nr:YjfB family protein [Gammaproteobacteria bacterium]
MDLSAGISVTQLEQSATRTGDAVAISVMKKAMDAQASAAAQLIESVPAPSASLPAHLGQNVNVKV